MLTHEPGASDVGAKLRQILLDPSTGALDHRAEALLYAADKAEHVQKVVRPALARGAVVITDRYVDSTLAYQGVGRDLGDDVERTARWATGDLRPHLTVVLDVDPGLGLGRFDTQDRIEAESHRVPRPGPRLLPRAGEGRPRPLPRGRRTARFRRHRRQGPRAADREPAARVTTSGGRRPVSVWDDLVGQGPLIATLKDSVAAADEALRGNRAAGMTHAWLFTGPPGSGRSNAAKAFAAALLCDDGGCGECLACRTALAGSHADVTHVVTDQSQHRVDDIRELVRLAALAPAGRRWQVVIIEDADRLNDRSADALLKSIEEPPPRTVWLLCAPTAEDVVATIRSRCRSLVLRTPSTQAVAEHLVARDGVPESVAVFAARASQGHIGRARALALDDDTRNRRREALRVPSQLSDLGSCVTTAAGLIEAATDEASSARRDARRA